MGAMSTDISNGYRLAAGTDPFLFVARLRAVMDPACDAADAALLAGLYATAIDNRWFRGKAIEENAGYEAWRAWKKELADTLGQEKAVVEDSGDCFVISGSNKVHLPTCPSMRTLVDRDAAWAPYLDDLERVRDWHGDDNAPPMPALMSRTDVEDLARYTSCRTCAPSLDHTDKRPTEKGWTLLKAGSLNYPHFETAFALPGGGELGALTKLSRVETANGLDFAATSDWVIDPGVDPLIEVMYRTGSRPQESQPLPRTHRRPGRLSGPSEVDGCLAIGSEWWIPSIWSLWCNRPWTRQRGL